MPIWKVDKKEKAKVSNNKKNFKPFAIFHVALAKAQLLEIWVKMAKETAEEDVESK